jgi:hypothetical protein
MIAIRPGLQKLRCFRRLVVRRRSGLLGHHTADKTIEGSFKFFLAVHASGATDEREP